MKTKLLGLTAILIVLLTSGCGLNNYIKDDTGKIVKHEETGHMLEKNILCRPKEDSKIYDLYKQNEDQLKFKLNELPNCENFALNSNKSESIWQQFFVKTTAWTILKIGNLVNNIGVSIMLVGLLIRILLLPIQIKSTKQSLNMKKASPEIQKIEKKYQGRNDNDSRMAKSQEIMLAYKKYKVSPMLGCLLAFIQLPIFFAFLQAIYQIPSIYEQKLFSWNLGMTPLVGFKTGNYSYIILVILIIVSTYFSFKYSMSQAPSINKDAEKQTKIMLYIMMFVIVYASFSLPTAIALYWIITYAFISLQTFLTNYFSGERKVKNDKPKIKEKLKMKEGMKYGKNNK